MREELQLTRRDFLSVTAFGALGASLMPVLGCGNSQGASVRTITVLGLVDACQALADESLEDNHYWLDNNRRQGSVNQGGASLITRVSPGDTILWALGTLDVETSAVLEGVLPQTSDFFAAVPDLRSVVLGDLYQTRFWQGTVAPGLPGGMTGLFAVPTLSAPPAQGEKDSCKTAVRRSNRSKRMPAWSPPIWRRSPPC